MERFDLYDAQRRPTGETMLRGSAAPTDRWRLVVHIIVFNSNGEMLIQQRQPFKDNWCGMWDLSVGGSVTCGETSQTGAERELFEELGITADLQGAAPAVSVTFDGGFDDYYILQRDIDIAALRLQYEEVQAAKWASLDEILSMIDNGVFIPYHKAFVEYLFFRRTHSGTHNEHP